MEKEEESNMKTKLFFIIICILFPVIAEGADWVKVTEEEKDKVIYYVDIDSIEQVSSTEYKARYKTEAKNNEGMEEIFYYGRIDCAERKMQLIQMVTYNLKGTTRATLGQDWEYVAPNTANEKVLKFVCSHKKGVLNIPKREGNQDNK